MDESFSGEAVQPGPQGQPVAAAAFRVGASGTGARVVPMVPRLALRIEPAPLVLLYAEHGPQEAEDAVCPALLALARHLRGMDQGYGCCDIGRMVAACEALSKVASGIGLADLAISAGHAADCAGRADPAALGATVDRTLRLGRRSLAGFGNPHLPFGAD